LALRDLLRKLGFGSSEGGRDLGVRRDRPARPRSQEERTIRVDRGVEPFAGPPPPLVEDALLRPKPAPPYVPPPPPVVKPRTQAGRAAPAQADGGATQYFKVLPRADLVGVLVATAGPLKGQAFTVSDGETRIGREQCDITLPDPNKRISRYHAKIVHVDGAFVIEANPEVAARNPTVVNDQEIEAEALCDGDSIRLGDCTFKFRTI